MTETTELFPTTERRWKTSKRKHEGVLRTCSRCLLKREHNVRHEQGRSPRVAPYCVGCRAEDQRRRKAGLQPAGRVTPPRRETTWRSRCRRAYRGLQRRHVGGEVAGIDDLLAILERQGFKCPYTGEALEPATAQIDHQVPVSRGGGGDAGNLQWLTKLANAAKADMSHDEFLAFCRVVVERHAGRTGAS